MTVLPRISAQASRWRWAVAGDERAEAKGRDAGATWQAGTMASDCAPAGRVDTDEVLLSQLEAAGVRLAEHHQHRAFFGPKTDGGAAVGHQLPWLQALPSTQRGAAVVVSIRSLAMSPAEAVRLAAVLVAAVDPSAAIVALSAPP
jgi:hypothetical protein